MSVTARRVGLDAVLVECPSGAVARAVYAEVLRREVAAVDVVPGATTILLDGLSDPQAVAADIETWVDIEAEPISRGPVVEIPTTYDGPDLASVARLWGMTTAEVAGTHRSLTFDVDFCGFAPGFAYCSGLPEHLPVPRLQRPRPRVEPGSVAVADLYTAVYPMASPGGWQILGRTSVSVWDPQAEPPGLLAPGTRVRFVDA